MGVFIFDSSFCFPLGFISRYHHLDAPSLMQVSGFSIGIHLVQCFFFIFFFYIFFLSKLEIILYSFDRYYIDCGCKQFLVYAICFILYIERLKNNY
jgi:hypothetical protein